MNIKLHTPKSLKMGSGMANMKQFLLSVLATSVSIALTFGTAAIIDNNKKQKEKREIVMMVMFDMYNSTMSVEKADSSIQQIMQLQLDLAKDTTQFDKKKFRFIYLIPKIEYTEATENIFSSSIETINTVGNVLFTENVAKFYQYRKDYKTLVCDSFYNDFENNKILNINSKKDLLKSEIFDYALLSDHLMPIMKALFVECKHMMDVTDEELEAYRLERIRMEEKLYEDGRVSSSKFNELRNLQNGIDETLEKLKLE